ncbi:DUF5710 domain-containing protein [Pseudomonas amygdali]|uniref:DUF5710 domain-containing protein n=1 Tax=Pseudomonas amygdali TaxID=47877 RepID=UPI0006E50CB9|nr:DUF5710 domain-containing protein [Pseudomonas amygdali]KPY55683.1 hypothetical protein ALO93_200097 [Pseudomonas amygdali pv. sesami]
MKINFGQDAGQKTRGEVVTVTWDSQMAVNGHQLMCGMTGAGKTFTLRKMVQQMRRTSDRSLRIHVMDVHGDIEIQDASTVMFSEQTNWGMNPLRVNEDPHFGGVRKRVQGFIATINRVMRQLGPKQEAALRNILYDIYTRHGFKQDDPSTWSVEEDAAQLLSDGSDGRLYIDVPKAEKDEAKGLGARWDGSLFCWWVPTDDYTGGITRWPPKTLNRTHPSISDALRMARHIYQMSFLGTGIEAITALEIANRAAGAYQRKLLESLRRGEKGFVDEKLSADLEKAKKKSVDAFAAYADAIVTGRELGDLMKYDSTDVLKSVVDRLENLNAIGIFKATPPPFDPAAQVWRYNIKALSVEERKLFVLFKLSEIFEAAVQRGEQADICEVVILDEAHIYADDDPENIINTIAKEARKFGLALICASQSPTHFTEDFIAAVATKIILGIDEMYWRGSVSKMGVSLDQLAWIRPQSSMLVQLKTKGATKNEWRLTALDNR